MPHSTHPSEIRERYSLYLILTQVTILVSYIKYI